MMNKTFDIDKINHFNSKTMVGHIGIEILEANKEFVCGRMPVDKRTIQPYGLLHGGASVAFAESQEVLLEACTLIGKKKLLLVLK